METMTIAIVGGTGTLGRHVATELRTRGHKVRVLSRNAPEHRIDLTTGEGLIPALKGCDVVVDASNNSSPKHAAATLVTGSRRLLEAEQAAEVGHHVCVSIVGCEQVPVGYYRAKVDQERVVEQGPVPWSIVRATQFHELIATWLATAARWRVLPVPHAALQTVAAAEDPAAVADVVTAGPRAGRITVAGPEVSDARDMARGWREATGSRALLLPVPVPGKLGRALRSGVLTTPRPDVRGTTGFVDWLRSARR
jgi:uncharacterized protein YbjT (DUF2867 family)